MPGVTTSSAMLAAAVPAGIQMAQHPVSSGYLWSVLLLILTPFLLVLVVGGGILRAKRRQLTEQVDRFLELERPGAPARGADEIEKNPGDPDDEEAA